MPLIVPGINSNTNDKPSNDQISDWQTKLMGKKITEGGSDNTTFSKTDLPKEHRVIKEGDMVSKEYKADRLNIHLAEDGTVRHVNYQ